MKKTVCAMLTIICLLSVTISSAFAYDEEIRFRDIPWDTDIVSFWHTVQDELGDPINEDTWASTWQLDRAFSESGHVLIFDENAEGFLDICNTDGITFYDSTIFANEKTLVAGYPISSVSAYAIPSVANGYVSTDAENSRIVTCAYYFDHERIDDPLNAYADLCSKLSSLYGTSDITSETEWNTNNIWFGQNNTYVLAYNGGKAITLYYGITNVYELVKQIENPESTIDRSSTDGL